MNTSTVQSIRRITVQIKELVRGQEKQFVDELAPTVISESVALDFDAVERIDAAGLAALITLYTDACKAGHTLTVSRPRHHVREILQLVGIDKILVADAEPAVRMGGLCLQESAA
ncbi:MAG TPA: STAS domain-containing protein [Terracidiphilus sp.]|nr:STAS domain-containing protein [Terracidiphilus sp.]